MVAKLNRKKALLASLATPSVIVASVRFYNVSLV